MNKTPTRRHPNNEPIDFGEFSLLVGEAAITEIVTSERLGRTELTASTAPEVGSARVQELTEDEKERLRASIEDEMERKFDPKHEIANKIDPEHKLGRAEVLRKAKKIFKDSGNNKGPEQEGYEKLRRDYMNGKKYGIREVKIVDDKLVVDVKSIPFASYRALGSPDQSRQAEEISSLCGVSLLLRTSDGKLIVQDRGVDATNITTEGVTDGNGLFAGILGTSAAGQFDAPLPTEGKDYGKAAPITLGSVLGCAYTESKEELGLTEEDMGIPRVLGLATDNNKTHDGFLLFADTHLTAEEIRQTSTKSRHNKTVVI
jgi:hypothetical protein